MKDANAVITLQALNGIQAHDLCVTSVMLYQLNYKSHMRAVMPEFGPLRL